MYILVKLKRSYIHEEVPEVIVVGVPDPYRGETVKAFIKLVYGSLVTEEEMIHFSKQYLAPYKVPKSVEFLKTTVTVLLAYCATRTVTVVFGKRNK